MKEVLFSIFIAFAGFVLALYLFHKKRKSKEAFICPFRGKCTEVLHSDYSKFMGIPVEILGMCYYASIAIGHGMYLAFPVQLAWLNPPLLFASTSALMFSLYLTFIQVVTLRKLCTWCLLSATFCLGIFSMTLMGDITVVLPYLIKYHDSIMLVHTLALALGLGAATLTSVFFIRFLRDAHISEEEFDVLLTLSEFIWLSLGVIVATGLATFLPDASMFLVDAVFQMKMIVVFVIMVNGSFLNLYIAPKLVNISFGQPHGHKEGELEHARRLSYVLGAISIASWYFVFILSFGSFDSMVSTWDLLKYYLLFLVISMTIGLFFENRLAKREAPWVN